MVCFQTGGASTALQLQHVLHLIRQAGGRAASFISERKERITRHVQKNTRQDVGKGKRYVKSERKGRIIRNCRICDRKWVK